MIIKPDYNVESIFDINFEELWQQGTSVVLFDLDSTVMPSKSGEYPSNVVDLLNELKRNFTVAIISNNKNKEYIEKVQKISDFTIIGSANKPSPKAMREFLNDIGRTPKETVMIGDRPLTDILAGKLLGAKTILVDSINRRAEGLPTRFVRKLERITIRR